MDRCGHNHNCSHHHVDAAVIDQLWECIEAKFATNKSVVDLTAELKKLEMGLDVQTSHVASAAAAMVIKSIQGDLDKLKNFNIEIVPHLDAHGHPVLAAMPDFKTIYLTRAAIQDDADGSMWDEWIAIPSQHVIGTKCSDACYKWERIGNKKIDLTWVKSDFNKVNQCIDALNKRLANTAKALANAILDKAVEPLKKLKEYINSPEYIAFVFQKLPRAAMGTDGLMTSNHFAILSMLAVWAANDHKVMGGGALGPDVIIHLMDKVGIPTDDLKKKYHHGCGICDEFGDSI